MFATYVVAALGIVLASLAAALMLRLLEPDLSDREVLTGLSALVAGGLASSAALALTVLVASTGLTPARLRLVPGRESGFAIGIMIVGVLSLGQALDSLTVVAGLAHRGSMESIRRALAGASGSSLFFAVVVIGFIAGTAEEVFFRGYMQSLLRERWASTSAIIATSLCFGILHADWVHTPLAFALGLYLGFITELSGSALPAVACHIVNNGVFTVLTAVAGTLRGFWPNVGMLGVSTLVFAACIVWLVYAMPKHVRRVERA